MGKYVGIDLGTTFSAVAYIGEQGQPQTIPNANNRFVTPSVVYFDEDGPLVGEEAKEMQAFGAEEAAAFFKRQMGDSNFQLSFHGQSYDSTALSALVLAHLKGIAEQYLGELVTHAVITVPAYFTNPQREATIAAGERAGLEVLSIISEPTAAALAYGIQPATGSQTVLVYDLGGGTFDVSVVNVKPNEQRVLGTDGDHQLGGKDWDDRIATYLTEQFEDEFGVELSVDDMYALLVNAEQAKQSLSARQSVDVRVQARGHQARYSVTRDVFEQLTSDLMARTQRLTERVLEDIGLKWEDLDGVLLVGGSTRMPMVRQYVTRMSGKEPLTTVNPDEAVALGAAIKAAMEMAPRLPQGAPQFGLAVQKTLDVISHSLGMIAINEDATRYINSVIIRKNQPIPTEQTRPYTLPVRPGDDNELEVFMTQGESDDPMQCAYLGRYLFRSIPGVESGQAVLDITYAYDKNGVVNVSAKERTTGKPLSLTVESLPPDVPARFAGSPQETMTREHLTVYLAFDLSGSMSGKPLREAQKAAHGFVTQCDLTMTSVGLISFSDKVRVETEASQNARAIARAIDSLEIGRTGYGNDTDPFKEVYRLMSALEDTRYAIILADGVWADQDAAVRRARQCHEVGIEVVAIGFGGADYNFLKQISSTDANAFFTSMGELATTFSSIAQELTENVGRAEGGLRLFKQ